MPKFKVQITETNQKIVEVDAKDKDDAIDKVERMYRNEEIVLTADDFCGAEFEIVEETD